MSCSTFSLFIVFSPLGKASTKLVKVLSQNFHSSSAKCELGSIVSFSGCKYFHSALAIFSLLNCNTVYVSLFLPFIKALKD